MFRELLEDPLPSGVRENRPAKILVVDDDVSIVEPLEFRLKRQGFSVLTASTGRSALEMARSHRPDLVLLDLRLPDSDGFAICQRLCDASETCGTPVIILSGMDLPDIVRRSRAAGSRFFMHKPYDPNALLLLIQQTIDEQRQWANLVG